MSKEDGGPAFPHDGQADYTGGMTLRDYFAAKAMALAYDHFSRDLESEFQDGHDFEWGEDGHPGHLGIVAESAYLLADAMLEARNK